MRAYTVRHTDAHALTMCTLICTHMSEPPTISNTQIEREERLLDPEVLSEVCRLKLVTRDKL
eukprot:15264-Heterococcus_DN1.PRE.1